MEKEEEILIKCIKLQELIKLEAGKYDSRK